MSRSVSSGGASGLPTTGLKGEERDRVVRAESILDAPLLIDEFGDASLPGIVGHAGSIHRGNGTSVCPLGLGVDP